MGLSCSRQDVDALNSNIKVFLAVPDTSSFSVFLMPDWTGRRLAHESRRSLQAASASHSRILLRLLIQTCFLPFFYVLAILEKHILYIHMH